MVLGLIIVTLQIELWQTLKRVTRSLVIQNATRQQIAHITLGSQQRALAT